MIQISSILLLNLIIVISIISGDEKIKSKMEEHKVIPDVLDKAPPTILSVKYEDGVEVNLGNILTPFQVKETPKITYAFDSYTYYTLLMIDPDAPTRKAPTLGDVRHWFVGNIKGGDIQNGDHISEYRGSGPPKGTGLHRYIFLLFKQNEKINFDEPKTPSNSRCNRLRFNTKKFIQKYGLGDPIAANFYQAEHDDYVEILNKNTNITCEI